MQRDEELKAKLELLTPVDISRLAKGLNNPSCWHCRIKAHARILASPFGELNRTTYMQTMKSIHGTVEECLAAFTDMDICSDCKLEDDKDKYPYLYDTAVEYCYVCKKWGDHLELAHADLDAARDVEEDVE